MTRLGRRPPQRLLALGTVGQARATLTDATSLTRAFEGVDAVVHCAAIYSYDSAATAHLTDVNVTGTRAVLEAAAAAGATRVVVTSSAVTRGSSLQPLPRDESHHLGTEPAPAYYASKVLQEQVALEVAERTGLEVVLALPTVVLGGPYDRLGPSNAIVLRYLLDATRSTFPGGCNVVDARDVGAGHVTLLERGLPGERYLLGGDDVSWHTLHGLVADLAGVGRPVFELPAAAAWLAAGASGGLGSAHVDASAVDPRRGDDGRSHYWYASDRAREIGYAARPAREAVAASLAWLAVGPDLPRVVRESLRLAPAVRAARPLEPRPLTEVAPDAGPRLDGHGSTSGRTVTPRRRPPRPAPPRRRPSPG